MIKNISLAHISTLLLMITLLVWIRVTYELKKPDGTPAHQWSSEYSPQMDKILSGPLPGLVSDFLVLDIFSIYYDAKYYHRNEDMKYLSTYMKRAQNLDPQFNDVYRLAGTLLAMDAENPEDAVLLLEKGAYALQENWEIPFYGGFIAQKYLKDYKKAFELMSMVSVRPYAPRYAKSLANKYVQKTESKEDAMIFLFGLMRSMPEQYQHGIKAMIMELQAEIEASKQTREE